MGGLRVNLAPWRQKEVSSDIEAIDRGEGRTLLVWFCGLYGDYPRKFYAWYLDFAPDGMVLRKNVLFVVELHRITITEKLLSARERMPENPREAAKIGSNGMYAAGGDLEQFGRSIISCVTSLGVLGADSDLAVVFGHWLRLRLPERWPWAGQLTEAVTRLQALPSG